jgi:collagenase-like PrtC family protease
LLEELPELAEMGIGAFRLSPHTGDMIAVAKIFRSLLAKEIDTTEARKAIEKEMPSHHFINGFVHGQAGMKQVAESLAV